MKFKKTALLISALLLTACGAEVHGEYYETVSETESVTVSLTEPEPEPEPFITERYDLGAFLPIVDKYKENAELEDKLRPYVEKIVSAEFILRGNDWGGFIPYAPGEKYDFEECTEWVKLDPTFARTKQQLVHFFDTVYTDNYIKYTEEVEGKTVEDLLFGKIDDVNGANYEERDGAVYSHKYWAYKGTSYDTENLHIHFYDGKKARAGVPYISDHGYGYTIFNIVYEEGYGWQLDKTDSYYVTYFYGIEFGAGAPRFEIAVLDDELKEITVGPEFVFTHFNETIDGEYIEYNGSKYYQVKNYYPVENMRKAFKNYISEYKWEWSDKAEDFVPTDEPLLQPCIEKYIDDVYVEFGGMLYRKDGSPVYEIDYPEGETDCLNIFTPSGINVLIMDFGSGERVMAVRGNGDYKIVSDLPLREVTQ